MGGAQWYVSVWPWLFLIAMIMVAKLGTKVKFDKITRRQKKRKMKVDKLVYNEYSTVLLSPTNQIWLCIIRHSYDGT